MKNVNVMLGGRQYEVEALSIKLSREWRKQFKKPFEDIVGALQGLGQIDLTDMQTVGQVLVVLKDVLLGSTDTVIAMLFAYSPALAADRELIEGSATDDEAFTAFIQVLRLAYPFGGILGLLQSGPVKMQTSKSSASPNGG